MGKRTWILLVQFETYMSQVRLLLPGSSHSLFPKQLVGLVKYIYNVSNYLVIYLSHILRRYIKEVEGFRIFYLNAWYSNLDFGQMKINYGFCKKKRQNDRITKEKGNKCIESIFLGKLILLKLPQFLRFFNSRINAFLTKQSRRNYKCIKIL